MVKVKKIGILSFAKMNALIMGLVGFLAGIYYAIGGFFVDLFVTLGFLSSITWETPGLSYGTILAFGALIGMPLISAVVGGIGGIIGAMLYNLFAHWFGGVNLEFEKGK